MIIKTLYKYERDDGGVTVSPNKPVVPYTECYRLIADEGKALTLDGVNLCGVVDVDSPDGWYEVDKPPEEEIPEDETIE